MDQKEMVKQMVKFNKAAFDNTFGALSLLQDQMERTMKIMVEQATWLPKEGKQVFEEWVKACKKGGEDFKKAVNDGFTRLESFFA